MANISAIKVGDTSYGITPARHTSTSTTYGAATASSYGHVKLSDKYTSSAGAAASGIGASSAAVYNAYHVLEDALNTLDSKFVLLTGNLPNPGGQATINASSYPSSQYIILAAQCYFHGADSCYRAIPISGWDGNLSFCCRYESDTTILIKAQSSASIGSSYKIILYQYA